uniref:Uncharacterized protein n=1 Tax=Streptomyces auratus AGR0001 TaxID=1160718 RepID=J1ZQ06_9ACTN
MVRLRGVFHSARVAMFVLTRSGRIVEEAVLRGRRGSEVVGAVSWLSTAMPGPGIDAQGRSSGEGERRVGLCT